MQVLQVFPEKVTGDNSLRYIYGSLFNDEYNEQIVEFDNLYNANSGWYFDEIKESKVTDLRSNSYQVYNGTVSGEKCTFTGTFSE